MVAHFLKGTVADFFQRVFLNTSNYCTIYVFCVFLCETILTSYVLFSGIFKDS